MSATDLGTKSESHSMQSESERKDKKALKKKDEKDSDDDKKDNKKKKKKDKKEKKESKKDKKDKRDRDDRHKRKRDRLDATSDTSQGTYLSTEDALEISLFKEAVQGRKPKYSQLEKSGSNSNILSATAANRDEIAASLGLSKGLIRTADSNLSLTQQYSKQLYGEEEENPAKRQRLKREQTAQRAIERARAIMASRKESELSATAPPDLMSRFSSGTR